MNTPTATQTNASDVHVCNPFNALACIDHD